MIRGYLAILVAAALWGGIGPIAKLAFAQGITPLEVAFWRATLTWICFGIHAGVTREVRIDRHDLGVVLLFGLTGVTCFYSSYQVAVERGGAAMASVLLYTAPAWVVVLAALFLKEKITVTKISALALTLFGVIGVSLGSGQTLTTPLRTDWVAIGCGLTAGFCYSLYYIFGKRFAGRYSSPNLFLYVLPVGAIGLLPFVNFHTTNTTAWMALGAMAFFCTYGAYFFYYIAVQRLEASQASIVATLEPVVAAVMAYVWWQERFSWAGYVGSVLIICAAVLTVLSKR